MKVISNSINNPFYYTSHPWVAAFCVIFGLAILAVAAFWVRKCKASSSPRHDYSALRLESTTAAAAAAAGSEKDRYKFEEKMRERDEIFMSCKHYLAGSDRYELRLHLGQIGTRTQKHWFIVQDKSLSAERLLTVATISPSCPLAATASSRLKLLEVFRCLQHPYILPVLDVQFWDTGAVALFTPVNAAGSLKDLVYEAVWHHSHERKYVRRGEGLPIRQVQCLGRQILEALLFLQNRQFPPFYHLHSGNVLVQNGVARIAGIENPLLGFHPEDSNGLPKRRIGELMAFGYLLFEITAGYELTGRPNSAQLYLDLEQYPQVLDVLTTIFDNHHHSLTTTDSSSASLITGIDELLRSEFFRGVELRELRGGAVQRISVFAPAEVTDLFRDVTNQLPPRVEITTCYHHQMAGDRTSLGGGSLGSGGGSKSPPLYVDGERLSSSAGTTPMKNIQNIDCDLEELLEVQQLENEEREMLTVIIETVR